MGKFEFVGKMFQRLFKIGCRRGTSMSVTCTSKDKVDWSLMFYCLSSQVQNTVEASISNLHVNLNTFYGQERLYNVFI